jgi:hypothetical protein
MKPTDHNKQLYRDMQEEPDKYSDQEIEAMMDEVDQTPDVDEAWQQFDRQHIPSEHPIHTWRKIAAILIGIITISGIAIAAIHIVRNHEVKPVAVSQQPTTVETRMPDTHEQPADTTVSMQPVIFDNIPFDKMLTEIANYYHAEVVFQNEEARQLRFYFVWYQDQPLEKVVETLNHFESVNMMVDDKKLIVR